MKSKTFYFVSYELKPDKKTIDFRYKIDFFDHEPVAFTETIVLPRKAVLKGERKEIFENLLQSLHLMLGISYYKTYCPPEIRIKKSLSKKEAAFWNEVYINGLGEFFYRNKINPTNLIEFPFSPKAQPPLPRAFHGRDRALVGIGGGKDSIVVLELLKKEKFDHTAFVVETHRGQPIMADVIKVSGAPSLTIRRILDPKLIGDTQALRGHVPVSAIYGFLGVLAAVAYDYSYVVVGNEYSSNFGNLNYHGRSVNHQWSKSAEFEQLFQHYIADLITPSVTYFSLLRPFFEIRVVEMFTKLGGKYFGLFSSCNRNFGNARRNPGSLWCGECAKCVFVFTLLAAFMPREKVVRIFKKDLFADRGLLPMFSDVLGFGHQKPFDCVGTFEEAQAALYMAGKLAGKDRKDVPILKTFLPKIKDPERLMAKVFSTSPAPTVPTRFRFLGMAGVLLLGYGKEGRATREYLARTYPKLKIGIGDREQGPRYLEKQEQYDMVVRSPGIPKRLVTRQYTTATNIFFSRIRPTAATTIGVTGSKGKSTTASLIYEMLRASGARVHLLGNIGRPVIEALKRMPDKKDIFVIELSSYQLDDIEFSPDIAVVTTLFPEHMDYHKGLSQYYAAKRNLINFQDESDIFVYNPGDRQLMQWAAKAKSEPVPFMRRLPSGGKEEEIPLLGDHNKENIKAAVTVAKLLKVPDTKIWSAIRKFRGLPHRLERVAEYGGITFYDDAISTAPESTIAAIKALAPHRHIGTIFLGGEDRGYDFVRLEKEIRKAKIGNIVLFPTSGTRMFRPGASSAKGLNILRTRSMAEAVKFAYRFTPQGSACLLSTASPSYSLWRDFGEKGDLFRDLAKKYSPRKR